MFQDDANSNFEGPPKPPPLPPPPQSFPPSSTCKIKTNSRVSPFIQKLQEAPHGYWFESGTPTVDVDTINPTGWYFFYGTLMEPTFLAEVLSLPERPVMHAAKIVGYSLKLWGQYPALLDGGPGQEVGGMAWEVKDKKHAARLREYETRNYRPAPCIITFVDRPGEDCKVQGYSFKYVGNEMDLREGSFDLGVWLKSTNRTIL